MKCWTKVFLSRHVLLETFDEDAKQSLAPLLAPLPDGDVDRADPFRLDRTAGGWLLTCPGGRQWQELALADAFYALESHIYDSLLPEETRCFIIHAAALLHRSTGTVLLLVGPSRCGKTTLSLALAATGHFRYLSEEAVGLTLEATLLPYPKPFRVRDGAERMVHGREGWFVGDRTRSGSRYVVPPPHLIRREPCPGGANSWSFQNIDKEPRPRWRHGRGDKAWRGWLPVRQTYPAIWPRIWAGWLPCAGTSFPADSAGVTRRKPSPG